MQVPSRRGKVEAHTSDFSVSFPRRSSRLERRNSCSWRTVTASLLERNTSGSYAASTQNPKHETAWSQPGLASSGGPLSVRTSTPHLSAHMPCGQPPHVRGADTPTRSPSSHTVCDTRQGSRKDLTRAPPRSTVSYVPQGTFLALNTQATPLARETREQQAYQGSEGIAKKLWFA